MTRPPGLTILALLLGWLAIAGIGNAIVWNLASVREMAEQIPGQHHVSLGGPLFTALALAYASTAAAACVGIWRMRRWAARAYGAWCAAVLALGIYMATRDVVPSLVVGLLFSLLMAGLVFSLYPYVRSRCSA